MPVTTFNTANVTDRQIANSPLSYASFNSHDQQLSGTDEIVAAINQIAISELDEDDKASLQKFRAEFDDIVKQNPADATQQIFALSDRFVQKHLLSQKPCANLLKQLSCELQIANQNTQLENLNHSDYKETIRKSISSSSIQGNASQALTSPHFVVSPVFTAHPTQLNRPESTQELLNDLPKVISGDLAATEFASQLWSKAGHRDKQPTVFHEATLMKSALDNTLASIRKTHKEVRKALAEENRPQIEKSLINVGNWIGGDRDGNPNITPEVLTEIVKKLSESAFEDYSAKLGSHKDNKPGSLPRLLIDAGLGKELEQLRTRLEATKNYLIHDEPSVLHFSSPQDFANQLNELSALDVSKLPVEQQMQLSNKLEQLKLSVDAMGFHGANTDIRQNSEMNQKTVGALLDASGQPESSYLSMNEDQRVEVLMNFLNDAPGYQLATEANCDNAVVQKELDFLNCYKKIQDKFGSNALKNIITANTESLSDMLEVCVMLKYAGLTDSGQLRMNVVPLIETVPDLKNANSLMTSLLDTPWYAERVKNGDGVQQVMLGYSDSMRSNGITSAAWEVYKNTSSLQDIAESRGIKMYAFHGRGGTEARGSGQTYQDEIQYLDGASLESGFRQTEQGEEVANKFGNRRLSNHNLSSMLTAALDQSSTGKDKLINKYADTMELLSSNADQHYCKLYNDPKLAQFLKITTPLEYVGLSNAGSRPASRKAGLEGKEYLAKLRAIPYTAAWYQSGSLAPAYFGLGTAMRTYRDAPNNIPGDTPSSRAMQLLNMYKEWPFFKNLIDRSDAAIQKADMTIARQYANILPGQDKAIFNLLESEYDNTREMIQLIKGPNADLNTQPTPRRVLAHGLQAALLKTKHDQPGIPVNDELMALSMQAVGNALGRFG